MVVTRIDADPLSIVASRVDTLRERLPNADCLKGALVVLDPGRLAIQPVNATILIPTMYNERNQDSGSPSGVPPPV